MKKLLTILSLLITTICFSQRPIQPLGTRTNEVKVQGALSIDTALFVTPYATLAAANVPGQYARTRGGSIIFVKNESALYIRNDAATAWNKLLQLTDLAFPTGQNLDQVLEVGNESDKGILLQTAASGGHGNIGIMIQNTYGSGVLMQTLDDVGTISLYQGAGGVNNVMMFPPTSGSWQATFPNKSGTLAMVSDIPAAFTIEQAQDATGAMINASLQYVDGTPLLAIGDRNFGDITTTGSGLNM